jgi:hypothetical protein
MASNNFKTISDFIYRGDWKTPDFETMLSQLPDENMPDYELIFLAFMLDSEANLRALFDTYNPSLTLCDVSAAALRYTREHNRWLLTPSDELFRHTRVITTLLNTDARQEILSYAAAMPADRWTSMPAATRLLLPERTIICQMCERKGANTTVGESDYHKSCVEQLVGFAHGMTGP